jgi:hypothetical protein
MAATRDTTAEHIKPLNGAIVRRVQLGATTEAGEFITEQSDGKWDPTNTGAVQFTLAVAVQGGADTEYVDAVFYGPVLCLSGATKGALIYATDTAGEPGESVGTKTTIAGFAESATVLFVQKQIVSFS